MLNLFDESEDFPPIPSPFEFGPLPPCPASTPSPKMERIVEVTETVSSASETGSLPQTEVEVLEFKEEVMSPKQDEEDVCIEQPEHDVDNYEYHKKNSESMHTTMTRKRSKHDKRQDKEQVQPDQHLRRTDRKTGDNPKYSEHDTENMQNTMTLKRNKKEKKQEKEKAQLDHHFRMDIKKTADKSQYSENETENMQKSMNPKRKKKENKLAKEREANKRKREAEEYCAEHQPQPKADDEVLSNGSPCDCPAHVHDRESPLKVAEVRF